MRDTERIDETIAAGKRNEEAMRLMRNWCAHARAKRIGGVGMIEQETGLPIGHFSMECDHAPTNGMATWNFGEAAVDFHDRNCVGCNSRKAVGFPNLSKLVAARDENRRIADARQRASQSEAAAALNERDVERLNLRRDLDAVNQAFIDDLTAFDAKPGDDDRQRLVEAARLAPDRFDRRVLDLLYGQSSKRNALALLALDVGMSVAPDEGRLVSLARRLFLEGESRDSAAQVLSANLSRLTDSEVTDLIPSAARLASPDRHDFWEGDRVIADSRLLLAMWESKSDAVKAGIEKLLDRRTVASSQLVGRLLTIIIGQDQSSARSFVRLAASRYVRAGQLLNDMGDYGSLGDIAEALDLMMDSETEELDRVLQGLSIGANADAKRQIASLYALTWRGHRRGEEARVPSEARLRLGLDRLSDLPMKWFDHEVMRVVADAFRYPPDAAWPIIGQQADRLIGAALLIDEQLERAESRQGPQASIIAVMEQRNLRSAAWSVIEGFLTAAARASAEGDARARFIETVKAIPEERAMLRGVAWRVAMKLGKDVEGIKAVLPLLYSGIVGASVIGRAEAAMALSELSSRARQSLPTLVFESFCVLLLDQYTMVHKQAVRALRQFSLPEAFRVRAAYALFNLVTVYSDEADEDDFLVDCIEALARFAEYQSDPERVRAFCCHALLKAAPMHVRSEARGLRHSLRSSDDFALVVAHVLPEYAGNLNSRDDEWELIRAMTLSSILKHRGRLVEVGTALAQNEMWMATLVADALHRAGAEAEAVVLLSNMAKSYEGTVRDERRSLFVSFPLLSYRMEEALNAGDTALWTELVAEWELKTAREKVLMEDERARDSRSRFSFPN